VAEVKYPNPDADLDRIYERLSRLQKEVEGGWQATLVDIESLATTVGKLVAHAYGQDVDFDDVDPIPDPFESDALGFPDNFFDAFNFVRVDLCGPDCRCERHACPYTEDDWEEAHRVNEVKKFLRAFFG
jgi:hypothetical protein